MNAGITLAKTTVVTYTPPPVTQSFTFTRTDGTGPITTIGGTATFDICISELPSSTLLLYLNVNNPTRAISSPSTLTFRPTDAIALSTRLPDGPQRTGESSGNAALQLWTGAKKTGSLLAQSADVPFPPDPVTETPTPTDTPAITGAEQPIRPRPPHRSPPRRARPSRPARLFRMPAAPTRRPRQRTICQWTRAERAVRRRRRLLTRN